MTARRTLLAGLGAALCGLPLARLAALPEPASPLIRRRYLENRFGQLHLRIAAPLTPAAAAPSPPPLLLLHQTALSGRMFDRFMPHLAADRMVIAADTPGYGESDRPASRPSLGEYADAILDPLRREFGKTFDVLGYHTGAAIAADMAARCSEIARCVLVSVPLFGKARRAALLEQIGKDDGQGEAHAADGSHLLAMWHGSFKSRAPGQSIEEVARLVAEKQRAGRFGGWALRSALEADLAAILAAIERQVLVIAPHDGLEAHSRAAAAQVKDARLIELPGHAYGLFDAAPEILARAITPFLAR